MTQSNISRQQKNNSNAASIQFVDGNRHFVFRSVPLANERVPVTARSVTIDLDFEDEDTEVIDAREFDSSDSKADGIDELRIHCQNASVLSVDELAACARQMELARSRLVQLLIGSERGLQTVAAEFLGHLAKNVDLSELVNKNKNINDAHGPVQNDKLVQDTAKQLESKLTACFRRVLSQLSQGEQRGCEATLMACRSFLAEIHFLPNFLQQVVVGLIRRGRHEGLSDCDELWLAAIDRERQQMIASRQAMINGNLRLVTFIAKQYNNQSMPFTDLIQDGTVGLIKAVDRYDVNRGVRFSTYAIYWIKQTISRAMVRQEKMVRLPFNMAAKASAVFETMNNYLIQNNKWPSIHELAKLCKLPEDEVKAIVHNYQPIISLDSNVNDDDDMPEMIATLEQDHFPQPLSGVVSSSLKMCLRQAVDSLTQREADIINCRFGLNNDHEMTLQDIAEKMSLTRERVRQIQNNALLKLKNSFSSELVDFLEPG